MGLYNRRGGACLRAGLEGEDPPPAEGGAYTTGGAGQSGTGRGGAR